jgi:hypothetical protein
MNYLIASQTAPHSAALASSTMPSLAAIDSRMKDGGSTIGGCGDVGAWAWP